MNPQPTAQGRQNPYRSLRSIAANCVAKLGWSELFLIPARIAVSPLLIPLLPERSFQFQGRSYRQFYHRYNVTWANERAVEVPIARGHLEGLAPERVLEVGNVMSHYQPVRHQVLDKFERRPGVINADITEYRPERDYDLILSISTFEHIGFDDDPGPGSAPKILAAINHCRRFLAPGGRLVLTAAPGYNREFDRLFVGNRAGASRVGCLIRRSRLVWEECAPETALAARYHQPYSFGNAVIVAEFTR